MSDLFLATGSEHFQLKTCFFCAWKQPENQSKMCMKKLIWKITTRNPSACCDLWQVHFWSSSWQVMAVFYSLTWPLFQILLVQFIRTVCMDKLHWFLCSLFTLRFDMYNFHIFASTASTASTAPSTLAFRTSRSRKSLPRFPKLALPFLKVWTPLRLLH